MTLYHTDVKTLGLFSIFKFGYSLKLFITGVNETTIYFKPYHFNFPLKNPRFCRIECESCGSQTIKNHKVFVPHMLGNIPVNIDVV